MTSDPESIVRSAFDAFLRQDVEQLREYVDADLEWTYLDPTSVDPTPETCHGRENLEHASGTWAGLELPTKLEELRANGDKVLVILHAPGLDHLRARNADDRNFHVATVRNGSVVAIRACRDRAEARSLVGLA
jgi:ketosteroid isomerase-like protein